MGRVATYLKDERLAKRKGGLYHKTQVSLAFNSNRIEGSRLTEEQTRYIFETRTIGSIGKEVASVDDIIETSNHFISFDYLLDTLDKPLSNEMIKDIHRILKTGTADAQKEWFAVGEWKKLANEVGGIKTVLPQDVEKEMQELSAWYNSLTSMSIEQVIEHHHRFETIHPFQDGNGRVGRLIMFRECLRNDITPFIIDNEHKYYYMRGLSEFHNERGYLLDTCLSEQDTYAAWFSYFYGDSQV